MGENISEITKQWQIMYATLGGISATLMGLLFVSLALHSEKIHQAENSHFLRLARLTFSNYLMLLILSLQMLVPMRSRLQLTVPMAVAAIIGMFWSVYLQKQDVEQATDDAKFQNRSNRATLVAYLMLLVLAFMAYSQPEFSLYLMLSPVLMLVVLSVRNSWSLLLKLQSK